MNRSPALLLPLGLALMGCSVAATPDEVGADAETSSVTAVVVVSRTVGFAGEGAARSEAVARFVRVRGAAVDDDALRMVGAAVDVPAAGTCTRLASPSQPAAAGTIAPAVELVDVGPLALETDAMKKTLVARRVPDVADLVSGVVYAARTADGEPAFPSSGRFVVRSAGRAAQPGIDSAVDVAPFTIEARVDGEPNDLKIGDQDAPAGATITLPAGAAIDLAWEPAAGASADDAVYVDVAPPGGVATARCAFADTGHAALAASTFGSDDGTMAVHRLHRESFHAKGIDAGEVRFDFARVVSYHRR